MPQTPPLPSTLTPTQRRLWGGFHARHRAAGEDEGRAARKAWADFRRTHTKTKLGWSGLQESTTGQQSGPTRTGAGSAAHRETASGRVETAGTGDRSGFLFPSGRASTFYRERLAALQARRMDENVHHRMQCRGSGQFAGCDFSELAASKDPRAVTFSIAIKDAAAAYKVREHAIHRVLANVQASPFAPANQNAHALMRAEDLEHAGSATSDDADAIRAAVQALTKLYGHVSRDEARKMGPPVMKESALTRFSTLQETWNEEDHPRDEDGKFTGTGSGGDPNPRGIGGGLGPRTTEGGDDNDAMPNERTPGSHQSAVTPPEKPKNVGMKSPADPSELYPDGPMPSKPATEPVSMRAEDWGKGEKIPAPNSDPRLTSTERAEIMASVKKVKEDTLFDSVPKTARATITRQAEDEFQKAYKAIRYNGDNGGTPLGALDKAMAQMRERVKGWTPARQVVFLRGAEKIDRIYRDEYAPKAKNESDALTRFAAMEETWNEGDHPRADDGKWTDGAGGGAPKTGKAPKLTPAQRKIVKAAGSNYEREYRNARGSINGPQDHDAATKHARSQSEKIAAGLIKNPEDRKLYLASAREYEAGRGKNEDVMNPTLTRFQQVLEGCDQGKAVAPPEEHEMKKRRMLDLMRSQKEQVAEGCGDAPMEDEDEETPRASLKEMALAALREAMKKEGVECAACAKGEPCEDDATESPDDEKRHGRGKADAKSPGGLIRKGMPPAMST